MRTGFVANEQEAYCSALDLSQLDDVIERYRRLRNERVFDCFQWWKEVRNYCDYETTHHLVEGIVKYECEDGARRDSFPYTRLLLQRSTQAPHLAEILFRKIHSSRYACLLLRERATSHIGLIQMHEWLHRAAQRLSDRYDYDRAWQQLVFAQALEVYAIAHDEPIDAETAKDTVLAIGGWLELYEETRSSARKSRILEQLATLDFEAERIVWIPEIFRVAVMAANAGQLKLAQRLVKYGASCKRSHSSVSFEPLDQLIELKAIADDATLNDKERMARLDAFLDDATQ